jgi:hypothetical protein
MLGLAYRFTPQVAGIKMNLSLNRAVPARPVVPVSGTSGSSIPVAMRGIIDRIAGSGKLTLAEKLSFADALLKAYSVGDWRSIQKILRLIAMIEASRTEAKEQSLKADELVGMLPKAQTASAKDKGAGQVSTATADGVTATSSSRRLLQLLTA